MERLEKAPIDEDNEAEFPLITFSISETGQGLGTTILLFLVSTTWGCSPSDLQNEGESDSKKYAQNLHEKRRK